MITECIVQIIVIQVFFSFHFFSHSVRCELNHNVIFGWFGFPLGTDLRFVNHLKWMCFFCDWKHRKIIIRLKYANATNEIIYVVGRKREENNWILRKLIYFRSRERERIERNRPVMNFVHIERFQIESFR